MKVIGLTGGSGSGKSTVAAILETQYGAKLLLADEIARKQMEPGEAVYQKIAAYYGPGILLPDGRLDRKQIAAVIFRDAKERDALDQIVHPAVISEILRQIEVFRRAGEKLVVVESAILAESGCRSFCDEVWVVTAPAGIRAERLAASRAYTRERIETMFAAQKTEQEYAKTADFLLENTGSLQDLEKKIKNHFSVDN